MKQRTSEGKHTRAETFLIKKKEKETEREKDGDNIRVNEYLTFGCSVSKYAQGNLGENVSHHATLTIYLHAPLDSCSLDDGWLLAGQGDFLVILVQTQF